jgi:thioredoxin-like negative regulator of GroEL
MHHLHAMTGVVWCPLCCVLQAAIALDSRNPLARFELAGVLMAQERLQEALAELQELAVSV